MNSDEEKKLNNIVYYGTFFVDENEIAIDAFFVQEVIPLPKKIIYLPLSPNYLIGIFYLKETLISIVKISELLKYKNTINKENTKIAIINKGSKKIAITIDEIGEVIKINNKEKENLIYPNGSKIKIINSAIKLNNGERIIQIIDPFELFEHENIPIITQDLNNYQKKCDNINNPMKKCISFLIGHVKLAFEITKIDEVVKVLKIEKTKFVSKQCIGIITLQDKKIPVVDFAKYLNLNTQKENKTNDITVLILKKDEKKFGLLIDNLENIISYTEEDLKKISEFTIKNKNFYKGCLVRNEHEDILILEQEKLFSSEEISEITEGYSELYSQTSDNKNKTKKIDLYVTFKINNLFAIELKYINKIIHKPKLFITPPGIHEFIKYMINLKGEMIAIIDTNKYYKIEKNITSKTEEETILIINYNEKKIGLIIEKPEDILQINETDKILLPNYIIKKSHNNFHEDVKEIIGISKEKNDSIIVLDVERMFNRIISKKIIENKII